MRLETNDLAFFPENLGYMRKTKRDRMIVFHFIVQGYEGTEIEILKNYRVLVIRPLFEEAMHI